MCPFNPDVFGEDDYSVYVSDRPNPNAPVQAPATPLNPAPSTSTGESNSSVVATQKKSFPPQEVRPRPKAPPRLSTYNR